MIEKLLTPAASAMLGLGLAMVTPSQEPGGPPASSSTTTEVKSADEKATPAPEGLADVYERLKKLRSGRLADRPKALSDEAARLYRQAVTASYEGQVERARALTDAARELTRALEVSLRSRGDEPNDPDLPPPPRSTARRVWVVTGENKIAGLPPEIGEETATIRNLVTTGGKPGESKAFVFVDKADGEAQGPQQVEIRILRDEGAETKRDVIVSRPVQVRPPLTVSGAPAAITLRKAEGDEVAAVEVQIRKAVEAAQVKRTGEEVKKGLALIESRAIADRPDVKAQAIELELRTEELDRLKKHEADARLHQKLIGGGQASGSGSVTFTYRLLDRAQASPATEEGAVEALKKAYEVITQARRERKGDDGKVYLDAARDLYNTARKEAQAKHFARAAELARAAEALTRMDRNLGTVRVDARVHDGQAHTKYDSAREKGNLNVFVEVPKDRKPDGEKREETKEVRIVRIQPKPDGETQGEVKEDDDAGPLQGIGVQIAFEDGKVVVQGLLPGGPAEKDGRIKAGDALAGVMKKSGALAGFADRSNVEITKLLRGRAGTKVKVVVQPKGSDDLKVYELERKALEVPKAEEPKQDEKAPKGGGSNLPPLID